MKRILETNNAGQKCQGFLLAYVRCGDGVCPISLDVFFTVGAGLSNDFFFRHSDIISSTDFLVLSSVSFMSWLLRTTGNAFVLSVTLDDDVKLIYSRIRNNVCINICLMSNIAVLLFKRSIQLYNMEYYLRTHNQTICTAHFRHGGAVMCHGSVERRSL